MENTGRKSPSTLTILVLTLALMATALLTAMTGVRNNALPNSDEIYHLLAARSVMESQTFQIGEGSYDRASLYTRYVALGYSLFGYSLSSAMLATAITFAVLIGSVFFALSGVIGVGTALLCAVLLMLAPHSLEFSTTVRFYMPHAVFFWLGAWLFYRAIVVQSKAIVYAPLAALALSIAFLLQPTTVIGVISLLTWGVIVLTVEAIKRGVSLRVLFGLAALGLLAAAIGYFILPLEELWNRYRGAVPWNEGSRIQYYYWVMTEHYNPFWALFPLFAYLAWWRDPRLGGLGVVVFSVCFVLHSFAGMKEDRYLYYAFPFFFVVMAMGLQKLYALLVESAPIIHERLRFLSPNLSSIFAIALAVGSLTFLVVANLGYVNSVKSIVSGTIKREQPRWDLLAKEHGDELAASSVLMTNSSNHAIYVFERVPIAIGYNRLFTGSEGMNEFSRDYRTGAILISQAASIERVTDCFPSGYLIAENRQWLQNPNSGVNDDMVPVIEARMERVTVPKDWQLRLYKWSKPLGVDSTAEIPDCEPLLEPALK